MSRVSFRAYAALNDFLDEELRQKRLSVELSRRTSIKDLIESLGVPHTEIEVIHVNGDAVDFDYIVCPDDEISIYPVFFAIEHETAMSLRAPLQGRARFVLDCHLGRLARYLRQLGYDTLYRNDFSDGQLADISSGEQRVLLTRDRNLLKRSLVVYGYFVRETNPRLQLDEVIRRFDLKHEMIPFGRCTRCNGIVEPVAKEAVIDRLEPNTIRYYDEFWQCRGCGRVYWEGSHYHSMKSLNDELLQ